MFAVTVRRTGTFFSIYIYIYIYIYIRYLRKCAFPSDHRRFTYFCFTHRKVSTDHRGSTPSEGKASVVSEHLCVGETKTANRVLQEIRTHF